MGKIDRELCKKRGERVKELLRDHKMRQIELADEIHVTPEHLNAILNGKRTLTLEHARFIARRFSVQLDWVMASKLPTINFVPAWTRWKNTQKHFTQLSVLQQTRRDMI